MLQSKSLSIEAYSALVATKAKAASQELAWLPTHQKNGWLKASAEAILKNAEPLIRANELDIEQSASFGLTPAEVDRLRLTPARIAGIAEGMRQVADLPDPIGEELESRVLPSGLQLSKIRVPLGVVFFIYESRPNVTADAAAICIKSGNAVILRGGKEAAHSSRAIVKLLQETAVDFDIPVDAVQLIETADRAVIDSLLKMSKQIDVVIPRGGASLIHRVTEQARMPVLKHFDGNCHVYVDQHADLEMAAAIVENAKCQRMGVCNACESILVHEKVASPFFEVLIPKLAPYQIELRGDEGVRGLVPSAKVATEEDWSQEYLGPILSAKLVGSVEEAIAHIEHYGSHHTDAIVTADEKTASTFLQRVDSAAVLWNASTRFNDGGEFGLGAEIGISTDKFHARGPCGLKELTSYKYQVRGTGQVRT